MEPQVGMLALLSGKLPQRLDNVVAMQLAQFDMELRKLDLDPRSGADCSLALGSPAAVSRFDSNTMLIDPG